MRVHRLRNKVQIAVIGGNGFLGRSIIYRLSKFANLRIFSIDKQDTGYFLRTKGSHAIIQQVNMDVSNESAIGGWFAAHPVDIIIYAAGYEAPTDGFATTSLDELKALCGLYGALNGIQYLNLENQEEPPYFLYLSSAAVYGEQKKIASETTKEFPSNNPGMSKLLGEDLVKRIGAKLNLQTCILRPCEVYGKKNYKDLQMEKWHGYASYYTDKIVRLLDKDVKELEVWSPDAEIDLIDVNYFSEFVEKCIQERYTGIYNLSSGDTVSIRDLVNSILEINKVEGVVIKRSDRLKVDDMNLSSIKSHVMLPYDASKYELNSFIEANFSVRRLEIAKQLAIETLLNEPLTLDTTALGAKEAYFERKANREITYTNIKKIAGPRFDEIEYGFIKDRTEAIQENPKLPDAKPKKPRKSRNRQK